MTEKRAPLPERPLDIGAAATMEVSWAARDDTPRRRTAEDHQYTGHFLYGVHKWTGTPGRRPTSWSSRGRDRQISVAWGSPASAYREQCTWSSAGRHQRAPLTSGTIRHGGLHSWAMLEAVTLVAICSGKNEGCEAAALCSNRSLFFSCH
ncbi:hypothetical protein NDU88_001582 [Pleurodeles waltl]|uniref:Uncharacterized protein n=1 Tax=Pleurodeles waltl TaxID=8319 RepID=A0AAV7UVR1_PLEWA|nr:hypothetical protein NDU88_001582 [Pleurodeles waltl]